MAVALVITVAVLASLAFIGWLIYRAIRIRQVKAHTVAYGLAVISGILTFAFFLGMDIPQLLKILVSILLGIALISLAAFMQRRRPTTKPG